MSGAQCETTTNLPFGDGQSIVTNCPGDPSPNHFTGKQRDTESNLDYFGARYYSSSMARFVTADWDGKPVSVPYAEFGDPQSLNLYAYVRNSPISRVDADGHNFAGYNGMNAGKEGGITEVDYDAYAEENIIEAGWERADAENAADAAAQQQQKQQQQQQLAQANGNPGVPVVLPNGSNVPDSNSPTGKLMSPVADLGPVAAAGARTAAQVDLLVQQGKKMEALGYLVVSFALSVGQGGAFDFQRSGNFITGFKRLQQFRDVSNYNVGIFCQKAGMSLVNTLTTAGNYAKQFSSNYKPSQPYGLDRTTLEFIRRGWYAGVSYY